MADILATWHLIQFTPDLRRREPRNIGVVLRAPDGWHSRFAHVLESHVDSTPRDLPRDAYKAWLAYFNRKMATDAWEDVQHALARRGGNFSVELGGHLLETPADGWEPEIARLYSSLVAPHEAPGGGRQRLRSIVKQVIEAAHVEVETDVKVQALFGSRLGTTTFDFSHRNGQLHLMKSLPLGGRAAEQRALAFNARVRAAQDARAAQSFVAFFDSTVVEDEDVIAPVEGVASLVDVRDQKAATRDLLALIGH